MSRDLITILLAIFGCTGFWQLILWIIQSIANKKSTEHKALTGLLHDRIFCLCNRYIDKGFVTPEEYKNLLALYEPYVGLGGNGTARALKEEVDTLPIRSGREL